MDPDEFWGVRYRVDPTRKHGVGYDKYFVLNHRNGDKVLNEPLGWASEGWTEEKAGLIMAELKQNKREGIGPRSLREKREREASQKRAEEDARREEAAKSRTLSEYWTETYLPVAQRSKKQSSCAKEEQHFNRWIAPIMGDMPLQSICLKQWDELVKTLSAAGLSARMKEYVTGTLRRILRHAYDRRMVDDAPPTGKRVGITGPGNNRRLRVISHEEEEAIMEQLGTLDGWAWRITRFAFLTGCRASEAFNLTWANVDFTRGKIVFLDTKNRDSREIPITQPLQDLFDTLTPGAPRERVFPKSDGTAYSQAPSAFQTAVERLGLNEDRTRLDRVVFHSIRHTVATRLAARLRPRDLMDVMGWRTVQMAMRYVHGNEDAKEKALSMLGTPPRSGKILPFQTSAP